MLSLSDFIVSLFLWEAEHYSLILQRQILHRLWQGGDWLSCNHLYGNFNYKTQCRTRDLPCWRTARPHTQRRQDLSGRHPGTPPKHPSILCVLQGCFEALISCHSTESSWCRERWRSSPSKAEWQLSLIDFKEAGAQFWGPGQPRSHHEHIAELEFKFTLKPQW